MGDGGTFPFRSRAAHSDDRGRLTAVAALEKERFGAESLERTALVRLEGAWRLYVSCATPNSKHWRIDAVEASDPAALARAEPRTVFPGTNLVGVKDPVVRRAGKEENISERTGIALPRGRRGRLVQAGDAPVSNARYLDVVARPGGGWFLFFEMPRSDGSHDLCFESK